MGQDASIPELTPFVFDRIKALAKGLVADSRVVTRDRLAAFAAAFANEWNAKPQLRRTSGIPFFLRSAICRARVAEHLLDAELGALSGVCQESWDSIQASRLTHVAYLAHRAALTAWPEMRPLTCTPLIGALHTGNADIAAFAPHRFMRRAASLGIKDFSIVLSKLVGAIAWEALAPDRNWFGHWVVDRIHDSSYSEAHRSSAGHHVKVFLDRSLGFTDFGDDGFEVGDDGFEHLFYKAYQDLEVQLQKVARARAKATFKNAL